MVVTNKLCSTTEWFDSIDSFEPKTGRIFRSYTNLTFEICWNICVFHGVYFRSNACPIAFSHLFPPFPRGLGACFKP